MAENEKNLPVEEEDLEEVDIITLTDEETGEEKEFELLARGEIGGELYFALVPANEESEEILKSAQRRALLKEEEILKEANAQASRTLERAEEQIALEKKRALNEVKDEVSEMAIGIASAVIERDVKADEHKALIDDFINNIGNEQ